MTAGLNSIAAIASGLIDWTYAPGGITGGHTDTKGLEPAIDATGADEIAADYGNSYPFAHLVIVIYAKVLVVIDL